MPSDNTQPEVVSVSSSGDGLAHLDVSVPVQGTFPVSMVHSLWTYYKKSAGAQLDNPSGSPAGQIVPFLIHLYKLKLIPKEVADLYDFLQGVEQYDDLYTSYVLAGAFDTLQHRAMLKATGSAFSPRYQADPFFTPYSFYNKRPALRKYPGYWQATTSLNPRTAIADLRYPGDLGYISFNLPDGSVLRRHTDDITHNPNFVFHYDNAEVALDSLRTCQEYYLGHSVPFNAIIASLTLNLRRPGDAISVSASGLYPVRNGFTVPNRWYTAPILCPYYTIMRLPTDANAPEITALPRASSSVLISGEISFSRMTDEIFYDGVTELLTCTPLPGTKFIFIADPDKLNDHRSALQKYAALPNPNTTYEFCRGDTPYVCMYACEFKDGKLIPSKSFWSPGDTQFLRSLAESCKDESVVTLVKELTERIS